MRFGAYSSWDGVLVAAITILDAVASARAFRLHVFTIATDTESCAYRRFQAFAEHSGLTITLLKPPPLTGNSTLDVATGAEIKGGFNRGKITLLRAAVRELPPDDLVVYTDAYDSIIITPVASATDAATTFASAFSKALGAVGMNETANAVMFGAEINLHINFGGTPKQQKMTARVRRAWDAAVNKRFPASRYPYLNAGMFMGRAHSVLSLLQKITESPLAQPSSWNGQSDQTLFSAAYLLGLPTIANAPTVVTDVGRHVLASSAHVTESTRDIFVASSGALRGNVTLQLPSTASSTRSSIIGASAIVESTPLLYHMPGCKTCGFTCEMRRIAIDGLRVPPSLLHQRRAQVGGIDPLTCHTASSCDRALCIGDHIRHKCEMRGQPVKNSGSCHRYHRWLLWSKQNVCRLRMRPQHSPVLDARASPTTG